MTTIADVQRVLDEIAPPRYAEHWDNVGLLAGDRAEPCRGALLCIDLSAGVLDEAERRGANLLVAYHPPIFKPLQTVRADRPGSESLIWRAIRQGCAIYSPHTALDVAEGGTNDVIAGLCGLLDVQPMTFADVAVPLAKAIVFVPPGDIDKVAEAMFEAGAGCIGNYHHCSFRIPGEGTFWGGEQTNPTVGQAGRLERTREIRLETICPQSVVPEVAAAIRRSHSYEEPAFEFTNLLPMPATTGIGRIGRLPQPTPAGDLAARLAEATGTKIAMLAGDAAARVQRVGVFVGSAGTHALRLPRFGEVELLVTGELKHHDARAYVAAGKTVIALGHWASERPALRHLAERIGEQVPDLPVHVSEADGDVWQAV